MLRTRKSLLRRGWNWLDDYRDKAGLDGQPLRQIDAAVLTSPRTFGGEYLLRDTKRRSWHGHNEKLTVISRGETTAYTTRAANSGAPERKNCRKMFRWRRQRFAGVNEKNQQA
jgi:hypothetical protein